MAGVGASSRLNFVTLVLGRLAVKPVFDPHVDLRSADALAGIGPSPDHVGPAPTKNYILTAAVVAAVWITLHTT